MRTRRWPNDFVDRVICGDYREIIGQIPDGAISMVIADPPYGIKVVPKSGRIGRGGTVYRPVIGDDRPFGPEPLLRQFYNVPMFLFGGNYYARALPEVSSWYVWDKRITIPPNSFADCEFIWSNVGGPARIFRHRWSGAIKDSERGEKRVHPTQKPVALMVWLIEKFSKPGDVVLDPFTGSGPVPRACKRLGRHFIAIDLDRLYCRHTREAVKREAVLN